MDRTGESAHTDNAGEELFRLCACPGEPRKMCFLL